MTHCIPTRASAEATIRNLAYTVALWLLATAHSILRRIERA